MNDAVLPGQPPRVEGEPSLANSASQPMGVIRRNLKMQVYLGGKVGKALLAGGGSKLNVNGGVLFAGSTISIDSSLITNIKYDRVKASVPDLVSGGNPIPASVSVVAWKN